MFTFCCNPDKMSAVKVYLFRWFVNFSMNGSTWYQIWFMMGRRLKVAKYKSYFPFKEGKH